MELIRAKELAVRLGINRGLIYEWARYKGMPHIRVGQVYLFDWPEIETWLTRCKVNA